MTQGRDTVHHYGSTYFVVETGVSGISDTGSDHYRGNKRILFCCTNQLLQT